MQSWDPAHYLKFDDERTRAAKDLAARIRLEVPVRVVDLGCGPGNSTQVLRERWPEADVLGVDHSAEMIAAATTSFPTQSWELADIADWLSQEPAEVIYSNAALQWIPDHDQLVRQLFEQVAPSGALAFQIPSSQFALVRRQIHEISQAPEWNDRMHAPREALTMHPPEFYYDALCGQASLLDIWESEYHHVLPSKSAIVDWIASTGLRPFLAVLSAAEQERFLEQLHALVEEGYATRADGKVLFPFRRLFVIAYR